MKSRNTIQMARHLHKAAASNDAPIWARIAELALKPGTSHRQVNVKKIAFHSKASDVIAVPGKVLAVGTISHAVTLGAFSISRAAAVKIKEAGGSIVSMEHLAEAHPAGTGVLLIG